MKMTKLLALATAALFVALNAPAFADGNAPAKSTTSPKKATSGSAIKVTSQPTTASSETTGKHTRTVHSMHKHHSTKGIASKKPKSTTGTKGKSVTDSKKTGTKQ